jgi:hypothetical protein
MTGDVLIRRDDGVAPRAEPKPTLSLSAPHPVPFSPFTLSPAGPSHQSRAYLGKRSRSATRIKARKLTTKEELTGAVPCAVCVAWTQDALARGEREADRLGTNLAIVAGAVAFGSLARWT